MELKDLVEKTFEIFECTNTQELKNKLYDVCINNQTEKIKEFAKLIEYDMKTDHLQKIYQYYYADRENKGQDYTPKSLASLVSKLSQDENETECLDMCCGSGALTIQKWIDNHNLKFELEEFDENVIPFLLFNMMLRNIDAEVRHKDVLSNETFNIYKISKTNDFGKLEILK